MAAIPTILKGDDSGAINITLATGRSYTGATLVVAYQGVTRSFTNLTPGQTLSLTFTHQETATFALKTAPILMRLVGQYGAEETVENAEARIKVTDCLAEVNAGGSFVVQPGGTSTDPTKVPITDVGDMAARFTLADLQSKVNQIVRVLAQRSLLSLAVACGVAACAFGGVSVQSARLDSLYSDAMVVTNVIGGGDISTNAVQAIIDDNVRTNRLASVAYVDGATNAVRRITDGVLEINASGEAIQLSIKGAWTPHTTPIPQRPNLGDKFYTNLEFGDCWECQQYQWTVLGWQYQATVNMSGDGISNRDSTILYFPNGTATRRIVRTKIAMTNDVPILAANTVSNIVPSWARQVAENDPITYDSELNEWNFDGNSSRATESTYSENADFAHSSRYAISAGKASFATNSLTATNAINATRLYKWYGPGYQEHIIEYDPIWEDWVIKDDDNVRKIVTQNTDALNLESTQQQTRRTLAMSTRQIVVTENSSTNTLTYPNRSGQLATTSIIDASDPTFSNAVLQVGLNIDTNVVAAINAMSDLPIDPTTGATTIGGILAALAAAVAWLKRNKLTKGLDNNRVPVDPEVTDLFAKSDSFSTDHNLKNSKLQESVNDLVAYDLASTVTTSMTGAAGSVVGRIAAVETAVGAANASLEAALGTAPSAS